MQNYQRKRQIAPPFRQAAIHTPKTKMPQQDPQPYQETVVKDVATEIQPITGRQMNPSYRVFSSPPYCNLAPGETCRWALPGAPYTQGINLEGNSLLLLSLAMLITESSKIKLTLLSDDQDIFNGLFTAHGNEPITCLITQNLLCQDSMSNSLYLRNDSTVPLLIQQGSLSVMAL